MKQIRSNSDTVISRDVTLERYLREIKHHQPLTKIEEKRILTLAQAGDKQAFDKIVTANLRFVVNCAKEYQYPGLEIIDLISAGNIGLMDAVYKYDLKNEVKFISYAVWWIKNSIIEFLKENVRSIHIPQNQLSSLKQLSVIQRKLEQEYETVLDIEQVSHLADLDISTLRPAIAVAHKATSLSTPIGEEGDSILEDLVPDHGSDIYKFYDQEHNKKKIHLSIEKLTPLQKQIIILSFGLEDGIVRSNEDISEMIDLTPERIRQIRIQSLDRLRNFTILK
jgi:RNA polymerase primary sigma factor